MGTQSFGNLSQGLYAVDKQQYEQSIRSLIFNNKNKSIRDAMLTKRSLIQWEVPHINGGQTIEMYINPQNIQIQSRKEINRVRTKGGYFAQYWGEDFDQIVIGGTTGSAAIEGINVLRDIYRSEQLALAKIVKQTADDKRRQSLMQLAASVTMWYQGQGYRGYFTDMTYTENAENFLIEYSLIFMVVEYLGQRRRNFLPWHRHPWSTSEVPNKGFNQSTTGGGYRDGNKVGFLNIPCFKLVSRITYKQIGVPLGGLNLGVKVPTGILQVAILRPDLKDPFAVKTDDSGTIIENEVTKRPILNNPYASIQKAIDQMVPVELPSITLNSTKSR